MRLRHLSTAIILLLLFMGRPDLRGQGLAPIDLTNRPLNALNDASAIGWNPSMLGIYPTGYELLLGLPYNSEFAFGDSPYAAFLKAGPVGAGMIAPLGSDSAFGALFRTRYFVGFGFSILDDKLWVGAGNQWLDAGGFIKSGEFSLSATSHPMERLLASLTLENLTDNNNTGFRVNANAAYRALEWATLYAGVRYNPLDTFGGVSAMRTSVGASIGLFENTFNLSGHYDLGREAFRFGVDLTYATNDGNFTGSSYFDTESGAGLRGGVAVLRYSSNEYDIERTISDDIPFVGRDPRGWAPERAYTPVGLQYRHSTNDALASPEALVRPCDGSGAEFDYPDRLMTILGIGGPTYADLNRRVKGLSPDPKNLYKAIRQEYYTTRARSRELQNGDSLALISRQGYSIGLQSVDATRFPEVSLIVQVTDPAGRNVRGLGTSDFAFRDDALTIKSVRPIDSNFSVPMDIVMIVDCSGSMRDEIESVRRNVESFVNTMQTRGADYRIGGVLYGAMIYDTLHPTSDLDKFKEFAANADAIGTDEITTLAIKAATEMNFRPGSQRVFVLITDDWAVQDNALLGEPELVDMLWNAGARLYTIGNPCSNNGAIMTRLSLGKEYNITQPFNSILDDIGADVTTLYQVTYESKMREIARVSILRGTVRDETGRPAPASFTLQGNSGERLTVTPNRTTGEYETEIAEGQSYSASLGGGKYLPLSETVDLSAMAKGDTITRNFTLRLPPTSLNGQVTDENNNPVSAEVRIEDAATGERVATLRTGTDGRYDTPIEEGRAYRLSAINPDYIPTPADLDARGTERGTRLTQDLKVTSIETAIVKGSTFKVKNIFFDFAKWELKPESYVELNRLVALLNEYPTINVEIGAHTDAVGSDRDNQTLSENRAGSVMEYLISKGIAAARLRSKGYGETVPIASNDNDDGRALNRRVEFKLVR